MSGLLPAFVVIPLVTAFILPLFGKKGKDVATILANVVTVLLLVLAIIVVATGKTGIYQIGKWTIPLGINLVLDGLSALMLLAISVVSAAAMLSLATCVISTTAACDRSANARTS